LQQHAAGLLLWARRAGDAAWPALSSSGAAARRAAANAGSATLLADVGSWTDFYTESLDSSSRGQRTVLVMRRCIDVRSDTRLAYY